MTDSTLTPAQVVDAMHAAFRRGDLAAIAAHWADDVDYRAPGVALRGHAARVEAETVWLNAFSENGVDTYARFEKGDEIVDFAIMSGRHTGPLALPGGATLPATGAAFSGPYAARYTIRDGKVVTQEVIYDRLTLVGALGLPGA
ncbi:MAG: ester cyclase [Micropepsaceae bacterium]